MKEEIIKKQIDIINLFSKKDKLEEVYKNQIKLLIKKNAILKKITNDHNNIQKNNINNN